MRSKIAVKGHPLHPLLVTLPIGMFVLALVADIVYIRSANPTWFAISYWSSVTGIITALVAALAGFGDYFTMARYSRAKNMATAHMVLNLLMVGLFTLAAYLMQRIDPAVGSGFRTVLFLHGLGVVTLVVSGWLGGEMVFRHRLAVVEPEVDRGPRPTLADQPTRDELTRRRFGA
jgi:uncharacterized membrane protein